MFEFTAQKVIDLELKVIDLESSIDILVRDRDKMRDQINQIDQRFAQIQHFCICKHLGDPFEPFVG